MSDRGHVPPSIDDLSLAVADGASVDWEALSSRAITPGDRVLIDRLRLIQQMSAIFKDQPHAADRSVADELREESLRIDTWGHLQLMEIIGRGAFGEVYRARDTRLDREVALKILFRAESQRAALATSIVEEGRLLARVRHPNVVTVYGADRIGDHVGVWMELVPGRTLEQRLQSRGPFGLDDLLRIGIDLCGALAAVHGAGLVHRDVKAQNVMEDQDGRTVLMDFGVAHASSSDASATVAPLTGTPLYLSPEIFDGSAATVQSDIYAVGVLLYHLATGAYPVDGRTADELRDAHSRHESTPLDVRRPDLNRRFVAVVQRALARTAADRYDSAMAMEAALDELRRTSVTKRRVQKYSLAIAVSAMAVLLVLWLTGLVPMATRGAIVTISASGDELRASDRDGRVVWRYRVPDAANVAVIRQVFVGDVDGDDRVEVLANLQATPPEVGGAARFATYCFSAQGDVLWQRTLDQQLAFRAGEYFPPWPLTDLLVYRARGNNRLAVAAHHHTWWPSMVVVLDPHGRETARFVNSGWLTSLGVTADSRFLLAAGVNNAHDKAAILAILDSQNPAGASPEAPGSEFECIGCPPGRPLKYFVFGQSDLKRASASEPATSAIIPTSDRIQLRVSEFQASALPARGIPTTPELIYEFSPDFQLRHASFTDSHWEWHRRLEAERRLDHPAERCPDRARLPVRVWEPQAGWRDVPWPR